MKEATILKALENTKGQSLVELALIITLLLALLFGITEFGRGWYYSNTVTNGARAGARFASENPKIVLTNMTAIQYAFRQIADVIPAKLGTNTFINISAYDKNASGSPATLYTSKGFARSDGTNGGDLSTVVKGDAVTVIVHYNFTPLSEAGGIIPVLSGTKQLTRKATMYYEGP